MNLMLMKFSHLEKIMNHHKNIQNIQVEDTSTPESKSNVELIIEKYVQKRSEENYSFENAIVNKKEYNNPSLLRNCINVFKINEYGSNFDAMEQIINNGGNSYKNYSNMSTNSRKRPRQEDNNEE